METRRILSLFEGGRKALRRAFPLHPPQLHNYCAVLAALNQKEPDIPAVQEVSRYIRTQLGVLSGYGGVPLVALATGLSMQRDPEASFQQAYALNKSMKKAGFPGTHPIVNAAFTVYPLVPPDGQEAFSHRARTLFNCIKGACPALSFSEDGAAAALLALDGRSDEALELRLHTLTELLTHGGVLPQQAWRMARVMALSQMDEGVAVERCQALIPALKARSFPLTLGAEPLAAGMLASLDVSPEETVDTAATLFALLDTLRGYAESRAGQVQRALCTSVLAALALINGKLTGQQERMADAVLLTLGNAAISSMNAQLAAQNGIYDTEG